MSFGSRISLILTLTLVWTLALPTMVQAQSSYPSKPVRLIVPFPPGQATDIVARLLAEDLGRLWGKQVIVDNRAGGASVPGMIAGRDAAADGYTLTFATSSTIAVNPALYLKLPYSPKEFALVHAVFAQPWLIVAHPASGYDSLDKVVQSAKKEPGRVQWGYGATALQLAAELFKFRAGVDITGVPYKGSGPAVTDLLGGQIMLLVDTMASSLPHLKAGKIVPLAVLSAQRVPQLPAVPTVAELGYPGYEGTGWGGLVAPKATPPELVEKIGADVQRVLGDPQLQQRIIERGAVPDLRGPKEWSAFVDAEVTKWADIVRRANVTVQ